MMLFDSHCHLDFAAFDQDRATVLENAQAAGVLGILNPAIDLETSRDILRLSQAEELVSAAVGVHPNSALTWQTGSLKSLAELAGIDTVLAIGEIGLDYYRERAPQDLQRQVFRSQLELAAEFELPVIVHIRDAALDDQHALQDAVAILTEWYTGLGRARSPLVERPGVLHSYSGDAHTADQMCKLGFFIGITGPVTFRSAQPLQQLVAGLPLDRLLIETDAPFLTPHPYRGKRNEPAYVRLVADKIANIRNLQPERIAQITTSNANRLFKWRVND